MKVALIGYGYLGQWHAEKLAQNKNINFYAIVEQDVSKHGLIKEKYPQQLIVADFEKILDVIQAVIIVTPTVTHFNLVKKCLQQKNIHIFCEKPLAHDFNHCAELLNLQKKLNTSVILQVGQSERCHQAWEILGMPVLKPATPLALIRFERVSPFKGRATDVSVVEDVMIHDLDLATFLFQAQFHRCSAWGVKSKSTTWDTVIVQMETKDHLKFEFMSSRDAQYETRKLDIFGTHSSVQVDLLQNKAILGNGTSPITYEKRDHLKWEQENFFNAILGKEKPLATFTHGALACFYAAKIQEALVLGEKIEFAIPDELK